MCTDSRASVIEFLLEAKRAVQKGDRGWIFSTRQTNIDTLAELEFNTDDVKREILTLSVTDYCDGPLNDPKIKGEVWIFGKVVSGKEIYIKLKLWGDKHEMGLRVISFHKAEKSLKYRYEE